MPTLGFSRAQRLSGEAAFGAVFDARVREARGPLLVYAKINSLPRTRLGLSVSRRVGNAVRRVRIKRLLREAFRLLQHQLPAGYDVVVVVKPHELMALDDYQRLLKQALEKIHARQRHPS